MYFTVLQNIHTCKHTQLCPGLSVCLQTLFNCLVRLLQLHDVHGNARFPSDCLSTTHPHHCMSSHTFLMHTNNRHTLSDKCTHVLLLLRKTPTGLHFLHVHSTFTFLSALKFISAFFPLYLSIFWYLHSLSSFFPSPPLVFFSRLPLLDLFPLSLNLQSHLWSAAVRCPRDVPARCAPTARSGALPSPW